MFFSLLRRTSGLKRSKSEHKIQESQHQAPRPMVKQIEGLFVKRKQPWVSAGGSLAPTQWNKMGLKLKTWWLNVPTRTCTPSYNFSTFKGQFLAAQNRYFLHLNSPTGTGSDPVIKPNLIKKPQKTWGFLLRWSLLVLSVAWIDLIDGF